MKITRRTFLKAAAATPLITPSATWAGSTAANSRITVGLIGMGRMSQSLLNHFLFRTQVLAVCDVDKTRRDHAKKTVNDFYTNNKNLGKPDCKAYLNYEDMLAREDIDTVIIITPDHWHALMTQDAVRAGKDVYCEKPLTHSIAETVDVMDEVAKHDRILQTGSQQRSGREFRVSCELARNGAIGEIERIECAFGGGPVPCDLPEEPMEPGLDWNLWLGPAPMRPYNSELSPRGIHEHFPHWRRFIEYGGGSVADWGAHHIDIAHWAMGMDDSGPVEILPPENKDASHGVRLKYANGVEVIHTGDGFGVHMFGTEGEIMVDRGKFWFIREGETVAKFTQREDGGSLRHSLVKAESEFLEDPEVRLHRVDDTHVDDFLRSVESRKTPIANEQAGGRTAIACHLINLAYLHREPMKWDPDKLTFAENTGNSDWLVGNRRDYHSYEG